MPTPAKIGRYEILEELGHGAMGAVYKARDPMMDRTVAVKTVLASALAGHLAAEYRERFFREARAAGRFSHSGIVTVHDVGEHEGTPFLVMEYITGRTLAQALESGEHFSFERIYEIGREIAEALGYAHSHGVVHRDIKPANIMLAAPQPGGFAAAQPGEPAASPRSGPERAKVTDFGVAKLTAAQVTVTGQLLGTPSFMPPEQFTGGPVDGRSDLFSLGVILYWMATGDKPFTGDTITAVSYKIVHTEIVPPRKINPDISRDFEAVLLKLLQKDPALRYATGEALAEDLAALRAGRIPAAVLETQRPSANDPDATLDIHAAPAASVAATPPRARSRETSLPSSAETAPQPHISTVAQPPASHRWQTPLLIVLVVAVLFLVWRQMRPVPVEAPTKESSDQSQPDDPAEPAPPPPNDQIVLGAPKPAPDAEPGAAAPPPAFDQQKLTRDIESYVADALKQADAATKAALAERYDLVARAMEQPVPADQSRIIIDAARLPPTLPFALEVDRQIVFRRPASGPGANPARRDRDSDAAAAGTESEDASARDVPIYGVPLTPGEHTIRVYAGSVRALLAGSNSVRGDFPAGAQRILTVHVVPRRARPSAKSGSDPNTRPALRITLQ